MQRWKTHPTGKAGRLSMVAAEDTQDQLTYPRGILRRIRLIARRNLIDSAPGQAVHRRWAECVRDLDPRTDRSGNARLAAKSGFSRAASGCQLAITAGTCHACGTGHYVTICQNRDRCSAYRSHFIILLERAYAFFSAPRQGTNPAHHDLFIAAQRRYAQPSPSPFLQRCNTSIIPR